MKIQRNPVFKFLTSYCLQMFLLLDCGAVQYCEVLEWNNGEGAHCLKDFEWDTEGETMAKRRNNEQNHES